MKKRLYTYAHIPTSENAYSHVGHAGRTSSIRLLTHSRYEKQIEIQTERGGYKRITVCQRSVTHIPAYNSMKQQK